MAQPLDNLTRTWTSGATESGIKLSVTDPGAAAASNLLELRGGAAGTTSRFSVGKLGEVTAASLAAPVGTALYLGIGTVFGGVVRIDSSVFGGMRGLRLTNESQFGWSSDTTSYGTADLILARDAANTLAQRNGTNPQAFRVYNTYTTGSDYERGFMRWSSSVLEIGTEAAGSGTARSLFIGSGTKGISISPGTNEISVAPAGGGGPIFAAGEIKFLGWRSGQDYNIFGNTQSGNADRAGSNVYLRPLGGSGNAAAGQVGLFASLAAAAGTSGHTFELAVRTFLPATGTPGLQFGGTTSSFPALKRDTVRLQARLADDSAFTNIQGKLTADVNAVAETPTATHTITIYDAAGTGYKVLCVAA